MEDNLVSVSEAAKILGRNRNSLFKVINKLKIEKVLIKSDEARGQAMAHISSNDFDILKSHIEGASSSEIEQDTDGRTSGYFYIIQLEPELDPLRLKLGFAMSVDERIRKHRTAAPYSTVLSFWPCKLLWEKTVIDCLAADSEKIHTEVFRVEDVDDIVRKAEAFFEMMPSLTPEPA